MLGLITSYIIPLVVPVLLVFKNLVWGSLATWGDAPFFYAEGLSALVAEPAAWTERGISFGGLNNFIWISPLMILYGVIGSNDLAVRLIFYLPAIFLSALGAYFFAKYLGFSKKVRFFASFVYLLNTYFILLIDGGQAGVAFAYGIFPFALLFLRKYIDAPTIKSFYIALLSLFVLGLADPRIFIVCAATAVFWLIYEGKIKILVYLLPLVLAWAGINLYWIYPLLANGISAAGENLGSNFIKWYHPLTLLSPHWPENIFGKVAAFNPFFLGVPMLIAFGAFFKKHKQSLVFFLLFLTAGFLSIGIIPLTKLPFGFALRDTTKFFIPIILFGGILIGRAVELVGNRIFLILVFAYLLLLIYPALSGRMNFVLSGRQASSDLTKIYENLKSETGFLRIAWFPEKHPVAYEVENLPAVDGRDLARLWPFANMNAGEDVFNFLNNSEFVEWFRVLGIKYLVLSDNPREIVKNEEDRESWEEIKSIIAETPGLTKLQWEGEVPVYQIENSQPRFFAAKKLTAIVGPPPEKNFIGPTVFFEDGKLDPTLLEGKDAASAEIVFSGKDKTDLAMSFLQKYFLSPKDAVKGGWAIYSSDEYLKYKYELLTRGVEFDDFDYKRGVSFSTVIGEKMEYNFEVPEAGDYVLAVRSMVPSKGQTKMKWEFTPLALTKGKYNHIVTNENDLSILNVVALIPKKDYDAAVAKADVFTKHFKVVDINSLGNGIDYQEVELTKTGALKYDFSVPAGHHWVILTDNYHPLWKLRKGIQYLAGVPAFSTVNAFYVDEEWTDYGIAFTGQNNVRWGIYWSVATILTLSVIYLRFSGKKDV